MKPALSIIIPTHKRPQILRRCLDAIGKQTLLRSNTLSYQPAGRIAQHDTLDCPIEVIIVSDGEDEKTAEMLMHLEWNFPIQYFAIPKSQQGVCRNRGAEKAHGEIFLFIGDDMFLAPDACEKHLKVHEHRFEEVGKKRPFAVLGHTTWDPSLHITPLMKWIESSGVQFGYSQIEQYKRKVIPSDIQHKFSYTSNISLPGRAFRRVQFREDVKLYGWEDVEWGKRLMEDGVELFYEPRAKVHHHHEFTDEEVWQRSEILGRSACIIEQIDPELRLVPRGWKKAVYRLVSILPTYRGKHYRAFLRGARQPCACGTL